jgi:hypothetical protein
MQTPVDVRRFRAFLSEHGHTADWPDSQLWLALRLLQRLRYSPDQPREANGRFASGGAKLSPDTGDGTGAAGTGPGKQVKSITEEEHRRDYCQGKQGFRAYMLRAGSNFAAKLKEHGIAVTINQAGQYAKPGKTQSHSVYLKGKDFDVRVADHKPEKGTKSGRPGPRYVLPVEHEDGKNGRIDLADLNKTLTEIVRRHGP